MEKEAATAIESSLNWIVIGNFALAAAIVVLLGRVLMKEELTEGVPGPRQTMAEFILNFFVGKARDIGSARVVRIVAPFLATCFLLIIVSNLFGMIPLPVLNNPPTAFFGVTLGLAICAVVGTLVISVMFNGGKGAVKHLFWPNPMQFVSEFTDVLSLSLRLFGNIGGEHMTLVLVMSVVPIGIPLILHVLGLIPAFVQALVFTLLTASFIAGCVHEKHEEAEEPQEEVAAPADLVIEGEAAARMEEQRA